MMKTILAGVAYFLVVSSASAQSDSNNKGPVSTDSIAARIITDTIPALSFGNKLRSSAGQPVYKLKPIVDVPLTAINTAWSLYALSVIYHKPPSDPEVILNLNKSDINWFDRWAVRPYSPHLDKLAYIPFNGAMPLPFIFLIPKKTRKDFFKLCFLYLEAMSITGILYTGSTYFVDRYRPYVYSSGTTMEQRINGGGKNSFYAGHPAMVATSLFFGAKVLSDYYPDSKFKWLFYTIAGGITATTAYLRSRGGMHFPSDLLLGVTQGTLTGILVPHFHKHKIIKDPNLSLIPYSNGFDHGLALIYRLK